MAKKKKSVKKTTKIKSNPKSKKTVQKKKVTASKASVKKSKTKKVTSKKKPVKKSALTKTNAASKKYSQKSTAKKVALVQKVAVHPELQNAIEVIEATAPEDFDEIVKELAAFHEVSDGLIIMDGPVHVPDFNVGSSIIVVVGDLIVDGLLQDCKGTDSSLLIVLGNVVCKNLITLGAIHIVGTLTVSNVIIGDSLCDYALSVGGDIQAPTILDYGHDIRTLGLIKATDVYIFNSVEDRNGAVKANLSDKNLNRELMKESNGEILTDLSNTLHFIRSGGTQFRV